MVPFETTPELLFRLGAAGLVAVDAPKEDMFADSRLKVVQQADLVVTRNTINAVYRSRVAIEHAGGALSPRMC